MATSTRATKKFKDIIKQAVTNIKRLYPHLDKSLIEMYINQLIPSLKLKNATQYTQSYICKELDNYINKNIDTLNNDIYKYSCKIENALSLCPCNRR